MTRVPFGSVLLALLALLASAGILLPASPAQAHAVLVRAAPPGGAALDRGPREISLRFSEPIDRRVSAIDVHDARGRVEIPRASVAADGLTLSAPLPQLPRGMYTVRWRVLSAVDGHVTSGFYLFAVGPASPEAFRASAGTKPDDAVVVARWIAFAAATILAGTLTFRRFVLPHTSTSPGSARAAAAMVGLTRAAALGVLVSATVDTVMAASALYAVPASAVIPTGAALSYLFETRAGLGVLARIFGGVLVLAAGAPAVPGAITLGAATFVLAGLTLNSHAGGAGWLAAGADLVHLGAAAAWAGAILALLRYLALHAGEERTAVARIVLPRFSRIATVSIVVLLVSGTYAATLHVPSWDSLATTTYGQALRGKIVLLIGMIALGAYVRFREIREPGQGLLPALGAEGALGVLTLGVAALLAVTPPPTVTAAVSSGDVPVLAGFAGDVRVQLTVTPNLPGRNRFDVVATVSGGEIPDDAQIRIRAIKLDEALTAPATVLDRTADGRYGADADILGVAGFWEIEVVVRRRGVEDATTSFPLRTGRRPIGSDLEAFRWMRDAQRRFAAISSWREREQMADGFGNGVLTRYEMRKPDRTRFETNEGNRTVIVGADRYVRAADGTWSRLPLPRPLVVAGPVAYMAGARAAALGPERPCEEETCQVVVWEAPDGQSTFAGWIGRESKLIRRVMMFAPAHMMTTSYGDFGAAVSITPP